MSVDQLSKLPGNAVTVRGLSPELKARLRVRAAHNVRSMEAEARATLEAALSAPDDESTDLGAFARGLFAPLGGIDLELPSRSPPRHPPQLGEPAEVTCAGVETMSSFVLDASALLAYLRAEPGADRVISAIASGASMTTLNFGEVAGWFIRQGADETFVRSLRARLVFPLIPFNDDLAIRAALLLPSTRSASLSLGDRACLALASRSGMPALTADRIWAEIAEAANVSVTLIR